MGFNHEVHRILLISHTGLEALGTTEVKLGIEHVSSPGNRAARCDVKVFLRNHRRRITQVTAGNRVGTRQVVLSSKIKGIFQSATTINCRAILTVLR